MQESTKLRITYDGSALINHEMDIQELASALLAVNNALKEANEIINERNSKIIINIKGGFKSGSLPVDLSIIQESIFNTASFFVSPPVTGTVLLLSIFGFTPDKYGLGLLQLIKKIDSKQIIEIAHKSDEVLIRLEDEIISVSNSVFQLFSNLNIRNSIEQFIAKPLQTSGIESVEFKVNDYNPFKIVEYESNVYIAPILEDLFLSESTEIVTLQIVSVSFQESNKWRFTDGAASFYASVKDKAFIHRVQINDENFAKDDILKVKLKKLQYETFEGIKTEYEILQVLEHRRPGQQLKLNIRYSD